MVDEARMTLAECRKYLARVQQRYQGADPIKKKEMLGEMQLVTGLHRKSLIRLLKPDGLVRKKRAHQRGKVYGLQVEDAIRIISESLDYICAQRLTPSLLRTARHLARHQELTLTPELETLLAKISVSTVQRILSRLTRDTPKLPRKGPAQANQLRKEVPMERIPWNQQTPGHFETDLVHHCGEVTRGDYVHTLQMVDVATGWSERVAVLGRSQKVMEQGFRKILDRLPFPVLEIHPDNGSEFFNDHLVRFWKEKVNHLKLSRSRPYEKNDNRFVEQKNDTLVRSYLGNVRLDSYKEREDLDDLYDLMWLYYNFFQPVLRLEEKIVEGSKIKRHFDQARTPFERLGETTAISSQKKEQLTELMERTNPRALRREIYERLGLLLDRSIDEPELKKEMAA